MTYHDKWHGLLQKIWLSNYPSIPCHIDELHKIKFTWIMTPYFNVILVFHITLQYGFIIYVNLVLHYI